MNEMRFVLRFMCTILCFFVISGACMAQIEGVNYWIKYNVDSSWYDCHVIMNAGETTTNDHRIILNSQYTLVVNTGDSLTIVRTYEPKVSLTRTKPIDWVFGYIIKHPTAQPSNDYYVIHPYLGMTAYFPPGTKNGDTIKLFSVKSLRPTSLFCGEGLSNFDKLLHGTPSMEIDISNGFTMGTLTQIYKQNSPKEIFNHAISLNNGLLVAEILADNYYWYDCDSDELISTTTSSEFKPESSGSYFCAIDKGDCHFASNCVEVMISNSKEHADHKTFVYPNPVSDELNIISSEPSKSIELYDINGSLVLKKVHGERKISTEDLPAGMYFLKFDAISYFKIVKM